MTTNREEKHRCENEEQDFLCIENSSGYFIAGIKPLSCLQQHYFRVDYCPMCGQKAEPSVDLDTSS